ncbi:ribonuclease H-like domain-containing protein [Tanacetum coccineum]|uniref:Ribonuclease H-like domain-containing protein n=1 Tax=Tanacetum coccineum TaxID=301880 RepID=A0ABQ5A4W5_9ASTR
MRMEQYLTHTYYTLWEVIVNGNAPVVASASTEGPIPPKTAEQKLARNNELKAKSTLLLAILNEHLLKFHGIKDTKTLWEAIKTKFGGNKESKKMFQKLISLKLLRSLPLVWNNIALIMHDTSSTNEAVNTAHDVPTARLKGQASSLTYADDVMFSFFVNQFNSPQLDNKDLEQIDTDDLEEMDLKWQVAMLTMRVECYNCHMRGHFARECRAPRNQGNRNRDTPRRIVPVETPANALVVQDVVGGYDWSFQAEGRPTDFALMAHLSSGSSSSSSSDSEVRDNSITELKNQLAEALKEKDDLKLKLENQMNENELHDCHLNKSEVFESASHSSVNEIEEENNQVNDRFKKVEG